MNWLPGGEVTAWGGLVAVILGIVAYLVKSLKKAGVDQQKAKEADAYAQHIRDIERAANAKPGGMQSDRFNRDNG